MRPLAAPTPASSEDLEPRRRPRLRAMAASWAFAELSLLAVILVQVNTGRLPVPEWTFDETKAFSGWESVVAELESRGVLSEPDVFLAANRWDDAAQLAFAFRLPRAES